MRRRSLKTFTILLLCIFIGGCSKKEPSDAPAQDLATDIWQDPTDASDVLNIQDYNMNIDEEAFNEDNNMSIDQVNPIDPMKPEDIIKKYKDTPVGSIVNTAGFSQETLDSLFYIEELNQDIIEGITGKSYKEGADIPYSDLRYIRVIHRGFDGLTHIGEMIVNKAIAEDVVDIFKELYAIDYHIEKMLLIDEYDADDLKSMADNNSSAFNYRLIEGTSRRSVHSDGLAIDINPLYNPYVRTRNGALEVLPESASEYVDRTQDNIYYIRKDDPIYKAFISRGFTWGGEWKNSKDYQHFEIKLGD